MTSSFIISTDAQRRATTCCFTGHRSLPADRRPAILAALESTVDSLIAQGVTDFISGGALGFDQIAAALILSKRDSGQGLRLIFALPCRDHDSPWNAAQRRYFQTLADAADQIIYVSDQYSATCMRLRNEFMVNHADYCVCAYHHDKSGTGQTVRYAKRQGRTVINTL